MDPIVKLVIIGLKFHLGTIMTYFGGQQIHEAHKNWLPITILWKKLKMTKIFATRQNRTDRHIPVDQYGYVYVRF